MESRARERFGVLLALALLHEVLLYAPPFYPFLIDGRGFDALFTSMLHASTAIHEARAVTEISPIPLEGKLTAGRAIFLEAASYSRCRA